MRLDTGNFSWGSEGKMTLQSVSVHHGDKSIFTEANFRRWHQDNFRVWYVLSYPFSLMPLPFLKKFGHSASWPAVMLDSYCGSWTIVELSTVVNLTELILKNIPEIYNYKHNNILTFFPFWNFPTNQPVILMILTSHSTTGIFGPH